MIFKAFRLNISNLRNVLQEFYFTLKLQHKNGDKKPIIPLLKKEVRASKHRNSQLPKLENLRRQVVKRDKQNKFLSPQVNSRPNCCWQQFPLFNSHAPTEKSI